MLPSPAARPPCIHLAILGCPWAVPVVSLGDHPRGLSGSEMVPPQGPSESEILARQEHHSWHIYNSCPPKSNHQSRQAWAFHNPWQSTIQRAIHNPNAVQFSLLSSGFGPLDSGLSSDCEKHRRAQTQDSMLVRLLSLLPFSSFVTKCKLKYMTRAPSEGRSELALRKNSYAGIRERGEDGWHGRRRQLHPCRRSAGFRIPLPSSRHYSNRHITMFAREDDCQRRSNSVSARKRYNERNSRLFANHSA